MTMNATKLKRERPIEFILEGQRASFCLCDFNLQIIFASKATGASVLLAMYCIGLVSRSTFNELYVGLDGFDDTGKRTQDVEIYADGKLMAYSASPSMEWDLLLEPILKVIRQREMQNRRSR